MSDKKPTREILRAKPRRQPSEREWTRGGSKSPDDFADVEIASAEKKDSVRPPHEDRPK